MEVKNLQVAESNLAEIISEIKSRNGFIIAVAPSKFWKPNSRKQEFQVTDYVLIWRE